MKLTRILFCSYCFEQKRPHKGSWYMEMNDAKNTFVEAQHTTDRHEYGFTPHLVDLKAIEGNTVYHETLCLMDGCGIDILKDKNGDKIYFTRHDTKVFLKDEKLHYFDCNRILMQVTKNTVLHYKARIVKNPTVHCCTLTNWNALVDSFETPSI